MATVNDERLRTVEETLAEILAHVGSPLPAEEVAIDDALGRVLAAPIVAAVSLPPWPNSAMDGYAVRAADVVAATHDRPVRLAVVGEAPAGRQSTATVSVGTAVRIATGAPIPAGADAVVQVELTTPLAADGSLAGARGRDAAGPVPAACLVHAAVREGAAVRPTASDVAEGETIVSAGLAIGPAVIALAAGAGVPRVSVRRRPRVAVLATGDEIRAAGESLGTVGIPDANGPGLAALARAAGCDVVRLGIAADDVDAVGGLLRRGVAEADAVVVCGGVSVGPYDVVRAAFAQVGRVELWRVAIQPGKPFAFGLADRAGVGGSGTVPLFGLPGNPVSSFVTYELFVRPVLRALAGHADLVRPVERAVLEEGASKSRGRRGYLRAVVVRGANGSPVRDADGRLKLRLAGGQGSHVLSALVAADGLAVVAESVETVRAGDEVGFIWLDRSGG